METPESKISVELANKIIDIMSINEEPDKREIYKIWAFARLKKEGIVDKTKVERAREFVDQLDLQAIRNWCELTYTTIMALVLAVDDLEKKNKKLEVNKR